MAKNIEEQQEAQKNPDEESTEEKSEVVVENKEEIVVEETPEKVEISKAELDELKKNADVSSQNFERAKKAETENKTLREELQGNESSSENEDEEVSGLKTRLSDVESELGQSKLVKKYPQLEESWDDFDKYREDPENKGMKLETAAKAFLVDKGLLETKRKGLEKVTGGNKAPQTSGMSVEDIENLRKTDGKKYREMVKKGQIKFKK
jgi:hypothetical protein